MTTYVDGAGVIEAWVNSLTSTLVGEGRPLQLGVSFRRHEGAARVPYGYLIDLTGTTWGGAENPDFSCRLSLQVYGPTRASASGGAVAYAEALVPLTLCVPVLVPSAGPAGQSVKIAWSANIDGPQWLPDIDEPRYVVDADFGFQI